MEYREIKHTDLIIAIAKEIVRQYKEQLEELLKENKGKKYTDPTMYEKDVEKLGTIIKCIEEILANFEQNVCDIQISNDMKTATFTEDSKVMLMNINPDMSREDWEYRSISDGIDKVFNAIGLESFAFSKVTASCLEWLMDLKDGPTIKFYELRHLDVGTQRMEDINLGQMKYNEFLPYEKSAKYIEPTEVEKNGKRYAIMSRTNFRLPDRLRRSPIYYKLNKDFVLDTSKIEQIVIEKLEKEIDKR